MATRHSPMVPLGDDISNAATQHTPWRKRVSLSSIADAAEEFLAGAGFDRGPWLVVAFIAGIAIWFVFPYSAQWVGAIALGLMVALGALAAWKGREDRAYLTAALVACGLLMAFGTGLAWVRSEVAGGEPFERSVSAKITGRILNRIDQPAEGRVRLVLAIRHPDSGQPAKVRVNVPLEDDVAGLREGAMVEMQARLMPPAPPMFPGAYNFARTAWFQGLAATGSAQGGVRVIAPGREDEAMLAGWQRRLSAHIRSRLGGSPGAIAAAFASGDRGSIAVADEQAMRDSGLTHLLSISGLHVSAVIGAAYFLAIRLLALWPWLVLRVRLPVLAAGFGAGTGIFYTLLTGAEVPTVRSCVGALLVLAALVLGREALSLRMVAVAGFAVLLLWPESLAGPSFQMSFAAVLSIVALHNARPVRDFLAAREENWLARLARHAAMLLVTGLVVEIALMPIVLFHFHRAGLYGAGANMLAIPLVTFITMPLIALSLLADGLGMGEPLWWLTGKSLELLLWLARFTAGIPGSVQLVPQMEGGSYALFLAGGMWLALWRGKARLAGFAPVAVGGAILVLTPLPDMLISGDGRQVAIVGEDHRLLTLRTSRSDYTRDNLMELSGVAGDPLPLDQWPGARCSPDFCVIALKRGGREWQIMMSRSRDVVEERALAAACERADIVIADRWLPRTCEPRWQRIDARMLEETGGLAINLASRRVRTVADGQGDHGWWRPAGR